MINQGTRSSCKSAQP